MVIDNTHKKKLHKIIIIKMSCSIKFNQFKIKFDHKHNRYFLVKTDFAIIFFLIGL